MTDEQHAHHDHGEILMGRWDCGSCGARRLRGDAYQCASCGAPRPADVKFYLPSEAEVISDREGIRAATAGADWQCAFCDSWMPATDAVCRNCQATLAESERRQKTNIYRAEQVPRTSQEADQPREAGAHRPHSELPTACPGLPIPCPAPAPPRVPACPCRC